MESTEERILHYQRGIDRSVLVLDKPRLLHCIKALSKLPVTMRHLKSTGIGRTVNSLRKIEEGVGDASKRLVTKWKEMVSNAPDSGESDEACVPDDPDNYESVNYDQENSSPAENNTVEDNYYDGHNGINRPEALEKPALSPPMVIDVNVTPEEEEPAPNLSDEEDEPEDTSYSQTSKHSSSKDKESKKDSKSVNSSKQSSSKDKKDSSKVSKNSKDNGHDEHKKKDKDRDKTKSKSESSSSKDKKHSSEMKKRKVDSSDEESNRKKQRLSVCENESDDNDEEPSNNFVIDNDDDEEEEESSSNERDSEVRESSKDRHKESSLKHSDKSSSSSSGGSKSKDKRSSSSSKAKSSSSSSHESSKRDKSSEERSKKDDKHKSKSSHSSSSSSSKVDNGKDKDKHSSKGDDKEKSKDDEKGKVKDKKEHKKSKEHKEKKKSKKTTIDGIDSMSGTSFADALGMCSMPPPKKKKEGSSSKSSGKAESSSSNLSPQSSPIKPSPSKSKTEYKPPSSPTPDSPEDSLALLAPNAKLEPLSGDLNEEVDLASTLPEPSPFYKPLPQVNHVQRRVDEEAMLSQVINAKVQRTKVYSGNKSGWTSVPSLQEICIRVLIENIDALEYTGGVPFDILKPVLERASADQLFMLEYHNPYLVEESDQLWKFHCNKYFKNKLREEMESWREMYMRCLTEREAKFKAITANIKQSIDKSAPVRSTKLAYVDHFVKPPRNVMRQQAKYGTAKVTTSASDLKKKLITGAAGPSGSSSGGSSGSSSSNVERISIPPPPPSRSRAPSSHPIKKTKAPLMAKALQAIKGRYKR